MRPDRHFTAEPAAFWAWVRALSQEIGYTARGQDRIMIPEPEDLPRVAAKLGLADSLLSRPDGAGVPLADRLMAYFRLRARLIETEAKPNLMTAEQAETLFRSLRERLNPVCPLPMNKQRGSKRAHAWLTGIVNMLIAHHAQGLPCDFDPRRLTTITRNGAPLRTLSRRIDGALPGTVNPVAVWEIKEYYFTTTFGSRVADGIYETQLDGMELAELRQAEAIHVRHYLILDAWHTWWNDDRAYLCRIVDMLHMGYVDEVLVGREVLEAIPRLVAEWRALLRAPSR